MRKVTVKKILLCLSILLVSGIVVGGFLLFKQLTAFKAHVQYVHVQDTTLAYYTRGQGEPIILLEGFGMTMREWDPRLLEKLSADHQLFIFDYPAVGLSTGNAARLNETELADNVIGFMDALKIQKAHLIGWSMGSFVAQLVAEKYPQRVDKLILVATAPGGGQTITPPDSIGKTIQDNLTGSWETIYVPLMFPSTAKQAMEAYKERIHNAESTGESPKDASIDFKTLITFENIFADAQQEQLRYEGLATITAETLVISGEKDMLLVPENARKVANRIPHAQLIIIPDAGHAVLFQDVDTFSTLINNFLQ